MFRYLYSFLITLYGWAAQIAGLFDNKAKLFSQGRKGLFEELEKKLEPGARYMWFHAASLGEFEQGRPIIERLKADNPSQKILLTFFSPSGYEVRKDYKGADIICYMPLDTIGNARRFIEMVNPVGAVFVKYEFWINYLTELKERKVPLYLVSAIFRPEQAFFKWWGARYRACLKNFSHLFVQDEASKQLLEGIDVKNVSVTGDTRFDRVLAIAKAAKQLPICEAFAKGHKVMVAGSSWPKDEELLAPYFVSHKIKLIMAPHETHESHVEEIIGRLKGCNIVRYTKTTPEEAGKADVLIIDCIGILSSIYRYGQVAYIGGGFGVGIHNILEPAVYGMPVMFGPNYHKFREAVEMEKTGSAIHIDTAEDVRRQLDSLFAEDGERLKDLSAKAADFVKANSGATDLILGYLLKK